MSCIHAVRTLLLTVLVATAANAEMPQPGPMAHFSLNGHANPEAPGRAELDLRYTTFRDDALYLKGIYEFGPGVAGWRPDGL